MKVWYSHRELNLLVKMFHKAVVANDPDGAAAVYGCLFDFLQVANQRQKEPRTGYAWKRTVVYLHKELDEIQRSAVNYPITIQQALVAKVILYQESRKAS